MNMLFRKSKRKEIIFGVCAVIVCTVLFANTANASSKNAEAMKAYKKFLKANVSTFTVKEFDFHTTNKESYKKTSSFLLVDMNKDGVSELVTYHPNGYKQGYLCVYKYNNDKVIRIKNKKNKNVKISTDCNAAGRYEVYSCSQNHLHVDWQGGYLGYTQNVYTMKNGKLNTYLFANVDELSGKKTYSKNGKRIDEDNYIICISKCEVKESNYLLENTSTNRNKLQ